MRTNTVAILGSLVHLPLDPSGPAAESDRSMPETAELTKKHSA